MPEAFWSLEIYGSSRPDICPAGAGGLSLGFFNPVWTAGSFQYLARSPESKVA